jgi:hypothetical protein
MRQTARACFTGLAAVASVLAAGWLLAGPINMGDLPTDEPIPTSVLVDDVTNYPSFWLPLGGAFTDFELKASTNNFQTLAYYYNSIWTNSIADDPDAKVFFTDSGAVNPRAWITSPGHAAILGQLTDANSVVRYVVVQPSLLVISPGGVTNNVSAWMNKNQSNLVWSYSRIDGVTFETDGGARQIWTPVTPTWIPQRTTP